MSKQPDITENVMSRIKFGHVGMKPRWYFIVGSVSLFLGIVSLSVLGVFLTSLFLFSLRTHGPLGDFRFQQILSAFPWWALVLTLLSLFIAIRLLKEFDFSYRKNFLLIAAIFVAVIIIAGMAVNYLGLDHLWSGRGVMHRLYQQYDGRNPDYPRGLRRHNSGGYYRFPSL